MAEYRKIVIEIMGDVGNGSSDESGQKSTDLTEKVKNPNQTSLVKKNSTKYSIALDALKKSGQLILQELQVDASRYFNLSEDYMSENNYNNIKTIISKSKSLVTSVAAAGAVGGAAGAVLALTYNVAKETISYENRMSDYYQALNANNYQNTFSQVRAGLTDGGKGTEN